MIDAEFTVRVTKNLNLHSVRKFLRSIQVYIDSDTVFLYKHHFIWYFRGLLSFLKFHVFGRKVFCHRKILLYLFSGHGA